MKKRKVTQPIQIDDLAALDKIFKTPEFKVLKRMSENRISYQKDHIVALPEKNPYLGVDKAYDRGIIAGIKIVIKNIETAANEMEKLAEKEIR
jgi:hypothetical protein